MKHTRDIATDGTKGLGITEWAPSAGIVCEDEPNVAWRQGVAQLVGRDKRVLVLGCPKQGLCDLLREGNCQVVVGAEIANSQEDGKTILAGDLENIDSNSKLAGDHFNVVVLLQFLERLRDPRTVLETIKQLLDPDGYVVAVVPNVAHGSIRLALLTGSFPPW